MNIFLNGEHCQCETNATIQALLEQQKLINKRIAVEINMEVIPRSEFNDRQLQEGDKVEIVHAIGGG